MTERVARVAVSAIVQRDDTVLLVQRGRGHALGKWAVPGGHVAFGEPLADAVEREVFEETGLRVRVERSMTNSRANRETASESNTAAAINITSCVERRPVGCNASSNS